MTATVYIRIYRSYIVIGALANTVLPVPYGRCLTLAVHPAKLGKGERALT